jgi:predicted DNA-binding transcriptional regulator AlpA
MTLPYPPPWQDIATLAEHICASEHTIENWIKTGQFPPHTKKIGGKRLWRWKDVEHYLASAADPATASPDQLADRIRHATRAAASRHN